MGIGGRGRGWGIVEGRVDDWVEGGVDVRVDDGVDVRGDGVILGSSVASALICL